MKFIFNHVLLKITVFHARQTHNTISKRSFMSHSLFCWHYFFSLQGRLILCIYIRHVNVNCPLSSSKGNCNNCLIIVSYQNIRKRINSYHNIDLKKVLKYKLSEYILYYMQQIIFIKSLHTFHTAICIKCRIPSYAFAFSLETTCEWLYTLFCYLT